MVWGNSTFWQGEKRKDKGIEDREWEKQFLKKIKKPITRKPCLVPLASDPVETVTQKPAEPGLHFGKTLKRHDP